MAKGLARKTRLRKTDKKSSSSSSRKGTKAATTLEDTTEDSGETDTSKERNDLLYHGKHMLLVVGCIYLAVLSHRYVFANSAGNPAATVSSKKEGSVRGGNDTNQGGDTDKKPISNNDKPISEKAKQIADKVKLISYQDADKSKLEFSKERPLLSLSLPNSGTNILPRYMKCGDRDQEFGRYWTTMDPTSAADRRPIGQCMINNIQGGNPLLQGCGSYSVWHELQFQQAPDANNNPQCFDLVASANGLEKLAAMYPNGATILNTLRDPHEWFTSLSYDQHKIWATWCNPQHGHVFPTDQTEEAYLTFYEAYHTKLRQFVREHPAWKLVEIDLRQTHEVTANYVASRLGILAQCWIDASSGTLPLYDTKGTKDDQPTAMVVAGGVPRPNDISYPLMVASLPRAGTGTTTKYFGCALGNWASIHQGFPRKPNTYELIGKCYRKNVQQKQPPLEECGHARVFNNVGFHEQDTDCYFPQLMDESMTAFAEAYPYGTVLMVVRTAESWYDAIQRWYDLGERLAANWKCQEADIFPAPQSIPQEWHTFYENYLARWRKFATDHPTITYIEIPLAMESANLMDDIFGMHQGCFLHDNKHPNSR